MIDAARHAPPVDGRFDPQNGVSLHERVPAFLGDASPGWALDVGCGVNTRLNALLRHRGLSFEGSEVSERMIVAARAVDPGVVRRRADVCDWPVPLGWQRARMLKLMAALGVGGVFVFSAGRIDAPGEHVANFMGPELDDATRGLPGLRDVIGQAHGICRRLEFDPLQNHLVVIVQRAP